MRKLLLCDRERVSLAYCAVADTLSSEHISIACTQTEPGRTWNDRLSQGNGLPRKWLHRWNPPASLGFSVSFRGRPSHASHPVLTPGYGNMGRRHMGAKVIYSDEPMEAEIWSNVSEWVQIFPSPLTEVGDLLKRAAGTEHAGTIGDVKWTFLFLRTIAGVFFKAGRRSTVSRMLLAACSWGWRAIVCPTLFPLP